MPRTDHSAQITSLREVAPQKTPETRTILEAAAGLLEVHDATGISLDDWNGPKDLVNMALGIIGAPEFTPNHV